MADKYTIQVAPQISTSDGKKMENDLNRRFANVSKKFGKNLGTSLKKVAKVGATSIAAGLAAVVLSNPFEKINSDLNEILAKFDNTSTRASQFGVDAGKYFEAEQILASTGVKDVGQILDRFATSLEKARPDQSGKVEDPFLKEFLGAKDDLDAFYAFVKTISKLAPTERNAAAETVFGEKMGSKIAEALQTDLSQRRNVIFKDQSLDDLNKNISKLGVLEGEQSIFKAQLAVDELNQKSNSINSDILKIQNDIEKAKLDREASQLSQFAVFAELKLAQERVALATEGLRADLTSTLTPLLLGLVNTLNKIFDFIKTFKVPKIFR